MLGVLSACIAGTWPRPGSKLTPCKAVALNILRAEMLSLRLVITEYLLKIILKYEYALEPQAECFSDNTLDVSVDTPV